MADRPADTEISFIQPTAPDDDIPSQPDFWQVPPRFGAVPVDEAPLGWEKETRRHEVKITKFQHVFPTIHLPFQEVRRVPFGHEAEFRAQDAADPKRRRLFPGGANRLFFGDNLHVMRQLPSESIDLIYIDPPFFSGRNYNVIFGDKNEVRSFSDIWEGGMPGYLIWLNARLFEMKRLLKPTGTIYVHLDWHAVHYVKVEMDKIFGADHLLNEIIWHYKTFHGNVKRYFPKKHDTLLMYGKGPQWVFNRQFRPDNEDTIDFSRWNAYLVDGNKILGNNMPMQDSRFRRFYDRWVREKGRSPGPSDMVYEVSGQAYDTVWDIKPVDPKAMERVGYPTQKPEELLELVVKSSSKEGDVVADFFCGGGTTPAVAQRLNRRWIACDQSRIAAALTADRVSHVVNEEIGALFPVPDFTTEHWGIYQAPQLEALDEGAFRDFVIQAFGGKAQPGVSEAIHGEVRGVPLFVGQPSRTSKVGKDDVARFAQAIYGERRAHSGTMLAWNFGPDAQRAADILAARENKRIDFVRLSLVRLEADEFREHVTEKHEDYAPLLRFIQPPIVRLGVRRVALLTYEFDVSESVSLNTDGAIANVQWDFDHTGQFASTQGYAFLRDKDRRPVLTVQYKFPKSGTFTVACSVQDDQGGERTEIQEMEVQ